MDENSVFHNMLRSLGDDDADEDSLSSTHSGLKKEGGGSFGKEPGRTLVSSEGQASLSDLQGDFLLLLIVSNLRKVSLALILLPETGAQTF